MKKRSIWWMVFFFVVTLGLYRIYWLLRTRAELLKFKKNLKIASPLFLIIPILLLAVSVVALVHTGNHAREVCEHRGVITAIRDHSTELCGSFEHFNPAAWSVLLFYVACSVFLPLLSIFFWGYSKAVSDVTKDRLSFPVAFLLLLVLPFGFDILLIQEALNDVKTRKTKSA